jgi:hypothetical protein
MATITAAREHIVTGEAVKADVTERVATGVAGAALLAGGVGAFFIGLMTTAAEASESLANSLKFVGPVGPLSGKTTVAVIAWLISWVGLNAILKNKEVNLIRYFVATLALIALGILLTFPPFFELFAQ